MDQNVRIIVEAAEASIRQTVIRIVLGIISELVKPPSLGGTPVDTGWARANWIPYLGPPPNTTVSGSGNPSSTGQQAAIGQVFGYKSGIVTIRNAVPYIVRLNEGSSTQAPAGFVQAAVMRTLANVRNAN